MKKGNDIAVSFDGLYLVHQNLPEKKVDFHAHDHEHILFIPLQGEIKVTTKKGVLAAGSGKMIYLAPGTEHAFDSSSLLGERLIVLISKKLWKYKAENKNNAITVTTHQLVKELLFYLLLNPKIKNSKSLILAFLQVLEEALLEDHSQLNIEHLESKLSEPRVKKAIEYLKSHFPETVEMEKVAKASGMSTRTFNRLFLQEVGVSPKQLLTVLRIEKAKHLLKERSSVTETAFEVGYQSLSQFIAAFRLVTGKLPSEWRHS